MPCDACAAMMDQLSDATERLGETTRRLTLLAGKGDPEVIGLLLSIRSSRVRCACLRGRLRDHRASEHAARGAGGS
jgi:hypothetical protein